MLNKNKKKVTTVSGGGSSFRVHQTHQHKSIDTDGTNNDIGLIQKSLNTMPGTDETFRD